LWSLIILTIVLVLLPFFVGHYILHIMIFIFLSAYLSQCWNILGGFTGQFSLGNAAFFGIGAYTSSLLFLHLQWSPWIGMFIGAIIALLLGLFVGYLSFHFGLKGPYFALATLAFSEILRILFLNFSAVGGARGILIPLKGDAPHLFQFIEKDWFYYISLIMMIFSCMVAYWIEKSRTGYYFKAICQNEEAAEALGIHTKGYKIYATSITAFLTAFGGTFYSQYFMYIEPDLTFGIFVSFDMILRCTIGGIGTIAGPIVGSFLITPLGEVTRIFFGEKSGVHLVIYSVTLIFVCLFMPRGVYPWIKRSFSRITS
jgi:branched-chain amino acid transport system permease protein